MPSPPSNDLTALQAYLAHVALGPEPPPELAASRLGVYRRLVLATLDDCIASILPRTAARGGDAFWQLVRRFYTERGPATHYLRDVPSELIAWWATQPPAPGLPAYALDLARHEASSIEVGAALDEAARPALGELALDRPVVFREATALRRYDHAVHRLPEDADDRTEPDAQPVALLIYRDASFDLRTLELSPTAAAILARLLDGAALQTAIVEGAQATGVPVDDPLLHGTAALLGDLAERGALLGGAA